MPPSPPEHPFRPALFRFHTELAKNNTRDWFNANKEHYEDDVRGPAIEFISACAPLLAKISPHFRADPRKSGGSLFRLHRDTRFSKDKSPYKDHTGIQFRHEAAKDVHAPGYYLHLHPKEIFVGLGIWQPDPSTQGQIREAILADPAGWKRATRGKAFAGAWSLAGESRKRPPQGVDKDHPLLEDLLRKDFLALHPLTRKEVTAPDFAPTFVKLLREGTPLMRFLCGALEVPF